MHRICTKYAKNICTNMQIYAIYMQKYANICSTVCATEICKNMQKYAKYMHAICKNMQNMQSRFLYAEYAKIYKICKTCEICTNMHKYTKYAKYAKSYRAPLRARHVPRNFACLIFCIAFFAYFVCFCI